MTELRWDIKRYNELSTDELFEILKQRQAVFVVEQNCVYPDIDDADRKAWHLCGRFADNTGLLATYARILEPGLSCQHPSIGRILTTESARGKGLAKELMQRAMRFIETQFPDQAIKIGAQHHLESFYHSLGFVSTSEPYDEDGIMHIDMLRG